MINKIRMPRKRQIFIHLLIVFIAGILLSCHSAQADESQNQLSKLQSASELDYPPFAIVRPDGTADGFSVDLLKAVVDVASLEVNISVGPWSQIFQQLIEGRIDVLPLVAYSTERDKVLDFTAPYLQMHGTIFVRKGETAIHSEADLKDKEVLVMRDDASHEYAVSSKLPAKLILIDSFEEAMKLLSSGEHDAILCQYLMGLQLINKLGIKNIVSVSSSEYETDLKPRTIKVSDFQQRFSFAVPEGRRKLLAQLNEGLAIVVANGTYDQLYEKWFGPILPQPAVSLKTVIKYVLYALVPILIFLAVMGIWYLRREIQQKTESLRLEIDERKQTELILRQNETLLSKMGEISNMGGWEVDLKTMVPNWTDEVLKIYEVDEVPPVEEGITYYSPESRPIIQDAFAKLTERGETYDIELQLITAKGRHKWVRTMGTPFYDDAGKVIKVIGMLQDITDSKQAEEQIKASLKEKETLLHEIHHRVKNNMQVISSLLDLQANGVKDEQIKGALRESQSRVHTMAAVHETLHDSDKLSEIDLKSYLSNITTAIFGTYSVEPGKVMLSNEIEELPVSINQASPLGLIINELISNSLKYAFPGDRKGEITVSIKKTGDQLQLTVADNGAGIPEDLDWRNLNSLGLKLVRSLAEDQLGGSVEMESNNGTRFIIKFNLET
jgi:PAS domain S-box-containing protein